MTVINADRLRLRSMVEADAAELHRIYSNADAMRFWSNAPFTDPVQTQEFVQGVIAADPATTIEFVIEHEGRVIGRAGFWRPPEIGYILHPDFWGQGFGSEAISALLEYGFQERGLTEVIADVDPNNTASLSLLKRLGFIETGREKNTIQISGFWYDSIYMRLSATDWRALRQSSTVRS